MESGEEGLAEPAHPRRRVAGRDPRGSGARRRGRGAGGKERGREGGSQPLPPHPGRPAGQGGRRGRQLPLRPSGAPQPRGALPASRGQMWTQQLDGEEGRGKEGRGTVVSQTSPPQLPAAAPGDAGGMQRPPPARVSPAWGWG